MTQQLETELAQLEAKFLELQSMQEEDFNLREVGLRMMYACAKEGHDQTILARVHLHTMGAKACKLHAQRARLLSRACGMLQHQDMSDPDFLQDIAANVLVMHDNWKGVEGKYYDGYH